MRCFLGITLPPDCRELLKNSWRAPEAERAHLRLSDPGQWHITLNFFGEINQTRLMDLRNLIAGALETPPDGSFHISRIETFPAKRPVYYIARCIPEQEAAWQRCVQQITEISSIIAPNIDRKPWTPHITLARSKHGKLLEPFEMSLNPIGWVPEYATLFLSELTPTGPKYTPLHEYRLNA